MLKRDAGKEQFWRETVARQADSGLSVRTFCQGEKLAESNFYAWRRELHLRAAAAAAPDLATAKPAEFVPVVVNHASRVEESITLTLASGHVLRLPAAYEPESLQQLLVALAAQAAP